MPDVRIGVIVSKPVAERDALRLRALVKYVADVRDDPDATRLAGVLTAAAAEHLDLLLVEHAGRSGETPDFGQHARVAVFSVAGGDDKAAEFPDRVATADLVVLTKLDLSPRVPFDFEIFRRDVRRVNARVPVLEVSPLEGRGMQLWFQWLRDEIQKRGRGVGDGFLAEPPERFLG
jgi:hydrogenase nickel incorporation protein HypB